MSSVVPKKLLQKYYHKPHYTGLDHAGIKAIPRTVKGLQVLQPYSAPDVKGLD